VAQRVPGEAGGDLVAVAVGSAGRAGSRGAPSAGPWGSSLPDSAAARGRRSFDAASHVLAAVLLVPCTSSTRLNCAGHCVSSRAAGAPAVDTVDAVLTADPPKATLLQSQPVETGVAYAQRVWAALSRALPAQVCGRHSVGAPLGPLPLLVPAAPVLFVREAGVGASVGGRARR
jgi:hypothetical protein